VYVIDANDRRESLFLNCATGNADPGKALIYALMEQPMSEKFDPARPDKHAANPKHAQAADKDQHDRLDEGLEGSFPASDPASVTQPAKSELDRKRSKG
jgi:hypothetical protein